MAPQQIQWGTITLHLDNEAFRRGFLAARQWYFADIYGEQGRQPEEPQHAVELTSEEVLRLVVSPDDQGRYHFDEMGNDNLPEYLGYLVGYLNRRIRNQRRDFLHKQSRKLVNHFQVIVFEDLPIANLVRASKPG